jgi:hypothetical protein
MNDDNDKILLTIEIYLAELFERRSLYYEKPTITADGHCTMMLKTHLDMGTG